MDPTRTALTGLISIALAACSIRSSAGLEAPSETVRPEIRAQLPISERTFRMGTAGFVPANFPDSSDEDWTNFLQTVAADYGGLFGVHLAPDDQTSSAGVPEQVQLAFEGVHGVKVYVAYGANHENGPFTAQMGERLVSAAVATVREYQPAYLSLGVESNSLFLFQPGSYPVYLEYVRRAYREVKEASPGTIVMNNFQLDRMRGATALAGQSYEPHWELIGEISDAMDMVSFTVYPFLHYRTVDEIPDQYLLEIRQHTDLPVMITETGWPSETTDSGVQGSDQAQIDYMMRLVEQANRIKTQAIVWVFPHDAHFPAGGGVFDTISLQRNDGSPKPAYGYWRAIRSLPQSSSN